MARMDVPMYHNTPKQFISAALGAHVTQEELFYRFTASRYACAVLAMGLCLSVCRCLSVRLSQAGTASNRSTVYYTSVDRNALIPLLRFISDLL